MAGRWSYPELVGANLMAGVLIPVLGIIGLGERILRWLPMPLAMGMLAGSVLGDISRMVTATVQDIVLEAFEAELRFGAVVAIVVSATTFSLLGIGSGFWALIAAWLASLVAERDELFAHWKGGPISANVFVRRPQRTTLAIVERRRDA